MGRVTSQEAGPGSASKNKQDPSVEASYNPLLVLLPHFKCRLEALTFEEWTHLGSARGPGVLPHHLAVKMTTNQTSFQSVEEMAWLALSLGNTSKLSAHGKIKRYPQGT